jgi:phosphohistidine phosphatase SixA
MRGLHEGAQPMTFSRLFPPLLMALALCAATAAHADEKLWALLKAGGQVVLVRHGLTTPGVGDPEGMKLDDCASQRNLNEEGRSEARRLGEAFGRRGIAVGEVLASPWCRCIETARLAFGSEPKVEAALGNLFGRPERSAAQLAQLRPLASRRPAAGNRVMVSHGSTILALTGVSPDTAEMVVLTPQAQGGFAVAGRMKVQ